jgi:hypothetical protein
MSDGEKVLCILFTVHSYPLSADDSVLFAGRVAVPVAIPGTAYIRCASRVMISSCSSLPMLVK